MPLKIPHSGEGCGCSAKVDKTRLINLLSTYAAKPKEAVAAGKSSDCSAALKNTAAKAKAYTDQRVLVDYAAADDAAVIMLNAELCLVHTVDFFPPVVDDPYVYGAIAAANAISDIYAMGAVPLTALNILCVPEQVDDEIIAAILQGGADKAANAGIKISGGHSIYDNGFKYGLCVIGTVRPEEIWRNDLPQSGDVLILNKKLGSGALTMAMRSGELNSRETQIVLASMQKLNRKASEIGRKFHVHAATDITGFGLVGHVLEMLGKGQHKAVINSSELKFLPGAVKAAKQGILPSAMYKNRRYGETSVSFAAGVPDFYRDLMFSSETSGGLLLALPEAEAAQYVSEMQACGETAFAVGRIIAKKSDNCREGSNAVQIEVI